jgi:hypothetical protein
LKTRVFRAARLAWILLAATMAVLVVRDRNAETPGVVLALMSYPASFLASELFVPFPVRVQGLPDPEIVIVPLAMGALGFVQWFVVVPWLTAKILEWHGNAPVTRTGTSRRNTANVIILLTVWFIAEIAAIALSMPLNQLNGQLARHIGAVVFHIWLAIPAAIVGAVAAIVIARLFSAKDATFWVASLACLFLCAGAFNAALVLFNACSNANRVGAIVEALTPAVVCLTAGMYASRVPHAPDLA